MVQLNLKLKHTSASHVCIFQLLASIFENLVCLETPAQQIMCSAHMLVRALFHMQVFFKFKLSCTVIYYVRSLNEDSTSFLQS